MFFSSRLIKGLFFLFIPCLCSIAISQNIKLALEGEIVDEFGYEVPYAAITIVKKNIGTSSNDEGSFYFMVTDDELQDVLEISSIGFKTYKISVQDFIKLNPKKIILQENITILSDVVVTSTMDYIKKAIKNLKKTTISNSHQLNLLYRRWSVEDNICRFFIEQYISAIDKGPSSYISDFYIKQNRTSSEYRYIKTLQKIHALKYMEYNNPLRRGLEVSSYKWKKTGTSSYDGEDIVIIEGIRNYTDSLKLYIGFDTYSIYKIEFSKVPKIGKSLTGTYIYKKHKDSRLYLSYHNREYEASSKLTENTKNLIRSTGKTPPNSIPIAFRHEVFVLGFEEDKKLFDKSGITGSMDMTLFKVPYDSKFWKNISLPPKTSFYKKNISELESLFNVPIETQFEYSN